MYQKKLQADFIVDYWLGKYKIDSADSDFEDYGPKAFYLKKLKKWREKQNNINNDLFFGAIIVEEDQTYAFNLVG